MSDNDGGTLRKVAWSEICPWLGVLRSFPVAISPRVLVLAAVAAFLTLSGWALLGMVFSVDAETSRWMRPAGGCPWLAVEAAVPNELSLPGSPRRPIVPLPPDPAEPAPEAEQPAADAPRTAAEIKQAAEELIAGGQPAPTAWPALDPLLGSTAWEAPDPFFGSWAHLSRPLWGVFRLDVTFRDAACLLLCGLWSLAIWALFGGAITRIAAVQLACDERVGWAAALRYACSKWLSYFGAPLFSAAGIALVGLPACFMGLVVWAGGVGVIITALIWPLLLVAGLVTAVLLLGLIFGWPLMWATISAEGTDSFDALQRSYSYVFRRPLQYLFYAIVAAVIGGLGWLLVRNFTSGVIALTYWAAAWGCGSDQIAAVLPGSRNPLSGIGGAGASLIHFWAGCVKLLAVGFVYGYFWTAATAIYFLLRRDEDRTETDEVFLEEDLSEPEYGLPPLETDEAGAPLVAEEGVDELPEVVPDDVDETTRQSEDAGQEDHETPPGTP